MEMNRYETEKYKHLLKAGPYWLWDSIGGSPIKTIVNYLAKKSGTNNFYIIKILEDMSDNSVDGVHGKNLMHAEYTLLKKLENEDGVVQQRGLFKDVAEDKNGNKYTRLCLVIDCYYRHDFSPEYTIITNLQDYVVKLKVVSEEETLNIFYRILLILKRLHHKNIVHHDIKLGNIILNTVTREVKLVNFCLGKQLVHEEELLTDQRGSPAYASPELIVGKPYQGKPSDMWALGVVLYTMLFGKFPFYAEKPLKLFESIKNCDYDFPCSHTVSTNSVQLINSLLHKDPLKRLTCEEALQEIEGYFPFININKDTKPDDDDLPPQTVPGTILQPPIPVPVPKASDREIQLPNTDDVSESQNRLPTFKIKSEPTVLSWRNLHRLYKPYMSSDKSAVQSVLRTFQLAN